MSACAFEPHLKNGGADDIGLNPAIACAKQIRLIKGETRLAEGITLYNCNDRELVCPLDTSGMLVKRNGVLYPEDFRHEQYLLIEEDGRRILFSGCSHKGILNIASWFRPGRAPGRRGQETPDGSGGNPLFLSHGLLHRPLHRRGTVPVHETAHGRPAPLHRDRKQGGSVTAIKLKTGIVMRNVMRHGKDMSKTSSGLCYSMR